MVVELRPLRRKTFIEGIHFHRSPDQGKARLVQPDRAAVDRHPSFKITELHPIILHSFYRSVKADRKIARDDNDTRLPTGRSSSAAPLPPGSPFGACRRRRTGSASCTSHEPTCHQVPASQLHTPSHSTLLSPRPPGPP